MTSLQKQIKAVLAGEAPLPPGLKTRAQYAATGGSNYAGYVAGFLKAWVGGCEMNRQNISEYPDAYRVQIYRACRGHLTRHFSFAKHGGKRKALRAARAHRDKLLATLPPPLHVGPVDKAQRFLRSSNTSGVTGVTLARVEGIAIAWRATWRQGQGLNRKHKHKDFYFKTDAQFEKAFGRAVRYRRRMEREHYQVILEA